MEPEAFERIFQHCWAGTVRRAARFLHERGRAEDVAQEVFQALWRHWPAIRDQAHARRWLLRAARLRAWSVNRSVARNDAAIESFIREPKAGQPRQALPSAIATALGKLPRAQQDILMHWAAGDSPRGIAEILARPVETIRTQIRRALAKLRKHAPPPASQPRRLRPERKIALNMNPIRQLRAIYKT